MGRDFFLYHGISNTICHIQICNVVILKKIPSKRTFLLNCGERDLANQELNRRSSQPDSDAEEDPCDKVHIYCTGICRQKESIIIILI